MGGCLSCNPAKTERWLAKQAAAAAAQEAVAATATPAAPPPEEPVWEALAEPEAVVLAPPNTEAGQEGEEYEE